MNPKIRTMEPKDLLKRKIFKTTTPGLSSYYLISTLLLVNYLRDGTTLLNWNSHKDLLVKIIIVLTLGLISIRPWFILSRLKGQERFMEMTFCVFEDM